MLLSVGCQYAIAAMVRIVHIGEPGRFCLTREIIETLDVPLPYLSKLLQSLVRAGILDSAKGRGGGFALARPPGQITMRQIVESIDGKERTHRCLFGRPHCGDLHPCNHLDRWAAIRRQLDDFLDRTTLAELARAGRF